MAHRIEATKIFKTHHLLASLARSQSLKQTLTNQTGTKLIKPPKYKSSQKIIHLPS